MVEISDAVNKITVVYRSRHPWLWRWRRYAAGDCGARCTNTDINMYVCLPFQFKSFGSNGRGDNLAEGGPDSWEGDEGKERVLVGWRNERQSRYRQIHFSLLSLLLNLLIWI